MSIYIENVNRTELVSRSRWKKRWTNLAPSLRFAIMTYYFGHTAVSWAFMEPVFNSTQYWRSLWWFSIEWAPTRWILLAVNYCLVHGGCLTSTAGVICYSQLKITIKRFFFVQCCADFFLFNAVPTFVVQWCADSWLVVGVPVSGSSSPATRRRSRPPSLRDKAPEGGPGRHFAKQSIKK